MLWHKQSMGINMGTNAVKKVIKCPPYQPKLHINNVKTLTFYLPRPETWQP